MLGIVFSTDICTRHRMSSKNVDVNICAHTWHSVSVMGHKHGFKLAVPEKTIRAKIACLLLSDITIFVNDQIFFFKCF